MRLWERFTFSATGAVILSNFWAWLGFFFFFFFLFLFCCIYCMKLKETSKLKHRILGIAGIALRNEFLLLPPLPLSPQPVCGFWKIWAETKREVSDENSHSLTLYQSISFSLSSLSSSQFFILKNLSLLRCCLSVHCLHQSQSLSLSLCPWAHTPRQTSWDLVVLIQRHIYPYFAFDFTTLSGGYAAVRQVAGTFRVKLAPNLLLYFFLE